MKKTAIIIAAVIYALAIVVVAFLGFRAEILGQPVYCDDIVLDFELPDKHWAQGMIIYQIEELPPAPTPAEDEIDEDEIVYSYKVVINDYKYFLDHMGSLSIKAKGISNKKDSDGNQLTPDDPSITYYIPDSRKDIATIDEEGTITFHSYKRAFSMYAQLSTNDSSNIKKYVEITWFDEI